jgi:hypothetical protein
MINHFDLFGLRQVHSLLRRCECHHGVHPGRRLARGERPAGPFWRAVRVYRRRMPMLVSKGGRHRADLPGSCYTPRA